MMRTFPVARVLLTAALAATALIPVPRPAVAAGNGTWVQQAPTGAPAVAHQLSEMHCPSTTVCYALGSISSSNVSRFGQTQVTLEKTTDGGVSWKSQTLDVGQSVGSFGAGQLACPSVAACYLLGFIATASQRQAEIVMTANGGQTWRVAYRASGIEPGQIACPSSAHCDVSVFHEGPNISEALLITDDGGQTWSTRDIPVSNQPSWGLSCPDSNHCYLAGNLKNAGSGPPGGLAMTHDGGDTWRVATAPRGQYGSIACPSADHCYALLFPLHGGARVLVTQDGGESWATRPVSSPAYGPGGQIECPSDTVCYALWAGTVWRSTDAGATWRLAQGSGLGPTYASCPTTTTCYAVGFQGLILKTTDGNTWWEPTPYTRLGLTGITCPSATSCYAIGAAGLLLATSDGGTTWVRRSTGRHVPFFSLACPSVRVCLITALVFTPQSSSSIVLRTTDGGQTWAAEKGVAALTVTCPSDTICYASAAISAGSSSPPTPEVIRSTDAGRTWTTQSTLPKGFGLSDIACSTPTTCVGVGGFAPCIDDYALRSDWGQKRETSRLHPDLQDCQESGWLFSTADGGRHWVRQFHRTLAPYATEGADLVSAACPTSTVCYAAGYGIWLRGTFDGRGWRVKVAGVTPTNFVQSLTCSAPATCWGIGMRLNSLGGVPVRTTNGGSSWREIAANVPPPGSFPQSGGLTALDCPTPSRCFAVGNSGLIMAYRQ